MKRVIVVAGVLVIAAAAVGAAVFTMTSGSDSAASSTGSPDHVRDHGHDHAVHTHGPNGECPLDAATAVGVEEPAVKNEKAVTPAAVKPGA